MKSTATAGERALSAEIVDLLEMEAKAAGGPWTLETLDEYVTGRVLDPCGRDVLERWGSTAGTLQYIVALRNAAPRLLARLAELEEQRGALLEALREIQAEFVNPGARNGVAQDAYRRYEHVGHIADAAIRRVEHSTP